jgi:hypothetical protein
MFTTSETYPSSFVRQIFHYCQPSHGDKGYQYQICNGFREVDRKVETQTKRIRYVKPHPALDIILHF